MIVLGIDPGTRLCGWGLIRVVGSRLVHVDNGVLNLPEGPLAQRLVALFDGLDAVIATYGPATAAVESVFTSRNARAALTLGHGRGVALLAVARRSLPVAEYTPQQIKKAVCGSGRADKAQIQQAVATRLGLAEVAQVDASDAVAVALCHAQHQSLGLPKVPPQPRGGRRRAKAGLAALVAAQKKGAR